MGTARSTRASAESILDVLLFLVFFPRSGIQSPLLPSLPLPILNSPILPWKPSPGWNGGSRRPLLRTAGPLAPPVLPFTPALFPSVSSLLSPDILQTSRFWFALKKLLFLQLPQAGWGNLDAGYCHSVLLLVLIVISVAEACSHSSYLSRLRSTRPCSVNSII